MTDDIETSTDDQAQLKQLRRKCIVKARRIQTILDECDQPMTLLIIPHQVRFLVICDVDGPAITLRELEALHFFLTLWLDLLDLTDGLLWSGSGGWCGVSE